MKVNTINGAYNRGKNGLKIIKDTTLKAVNNKYFCAGFWGAATVAQVAASTDEFRQDDTFNAVAWLMGAVVAGALYMRNLISAIKDKSKETM